MVLDVVDPVPQVPEAFGEVHLQQIPQQVLQVRAEVRGEPDLQNTLNMSFAIDPIAQLYTS